MPKEHHIITRLKRFLPVFNAYFGRHQTTKSVLPKMELSIATIAREAQALQAGLGHLQESHFDGQELSDEFAHLVTFAINLPTTIEGDGGFWGYALNLVDRDAFKQGAEYCEIERLQDFIKAMDEVLTVKFEIRPPSSDDL